MLNMKAYGKLIKLEATAPMDGGVMYFLSGYFVRFIRTLLLLSIWKSVFSQAGDTTAKQMQEVLQYTLLSSVFWQQVDVQTTASVTFWEGTVSSRFLRPMRIFGQYISETVGRWLPGLIFFSLPVLLLSPALGIDMRPAGFAALGLFGVSLVFGMLLGFAMDFIFTGLMVLLGNMHYFASQIRAAVTVLLSGALIPLYLLPWGVGRVLAWLPFASMANAPLTIYTGTAENVARIIFLQIIWCIVLWTLAFYVWMKNRQRLVIFGG